MNKISDRKWLCLCIDVSTTRYSDYYKHIFALHSIGTHAKGDYLTYYFASEQKDAIKAIIEDFNDKYKESIKLNSIQYDDWHLSYRDHFQPIIIDEKFAIIPEWYNGEYTKLMHIRILPGMAFGTGHHESTKLIISSLMKYLTPNSQVLDLGTGSGILALVSLKYGARLVDAIEIDEDCTDNFYENMRLNEIDSGFTFNIRDVFEQNNFKYDFITANIDFNVINRILPIIKKGKLSKTKLLLSGLLLTDKSKILEKIHECQFNVLEVNVEGEWICFCIN